MPKPPHLNPSERNALYSLIVARLTGINDVYDAIAREDWVSADRLTGEFSDYLSFIQDLGWGEHGTGVELSADPNVLRRVLERLLERAEVEDKDEAEERKEIAEHAERNRLVRVVCTEQLKRLETST
jgi:hypothetical protein